MFRQLLQHLQWMIWKISITEEEIIMSAKGLEAQRNYPLNKKLKEIFWGSWCMQTNWNYERQMNTAFMYVTGW